MKMDSLKDALDFAENNWTVDDVRELARLLDKYYFAALSDASGLARRYGEQNPGNAGNSKEGYSNLARDILGLTNTQ